LIIWTHEIMTHSYFYFVVVVVSCPVGEKNIMTLLAPLAFSWREVEEFLFSFFA